MSGDSPGDCQKPSLKAVDVGLLEGVLQMTSVPVKHVDVGLMEEWLEFQIL